MTQLDDDTLALVRAHKLREASIVEMRAAYFRGESVGPLLLRTIIGDRLSGNQPSILLLAAFSVSAAELQMFRLWKDGWLTDGQFDGGIRKVVAELNPAWLSTTG